ncbi:MAG: L-serine ammonia-lyase [Spirochaetales bacterium]|nr:L-serine ammonia-lyase [Spirochaetales bacterium]
MESIRNIYRIGYGPSSSHTMGPQRASEIFLKRNPDASKYEVILYGSLALTGKGHFTDRILYQTFPAETLEMIWKPQEVLPFHTNGMKLKALGPGGAIQDEATVYSVGGGAIRWEPEPEKAEESIYPLTSMKELIRYARQSGKSLWEIVEDREGVEIWDYLKEIWEQMKQSIRNGLENEHVLPGDLNLPRKAASYYAKAINSTGILKHRGKIFAYALAVSEENAGGGKVVTAPTCGSCGVLPSVLFNLQEQYNYRDSKILKALATAGLIGNLVKYNASISGAEVGCQGEVGTACAMAAAAAAKLFGGTLDQIEYAAEMGIEHHLGLTCDPVGGYVQIPCIERNGLAAGRAYESAVYALFSDGRHRVSFDEVVQTMKETGRDLHSSYRETSIAGLARHSGRNSES